MVVIVSVRGMMKSTDMIRIFNAGRERAGSRIDLRRDDIYPARAALGQPGGLREEPNGVN
jgi:hypothetical protein